MTNTQHPASAPDLRIARAVADRDRARTRVRRVTVAGSALALLASTGLTAGIASASQNPSAGIRHLSRTTTPAARAATRQARVRAVAVRAAAKRGKHRRHVSVLTSARPAPLASTSSGPAPAPIAAGTTPATPAPSVVTSGS